MSHPYIKTTQRAKNQGVFALPSSFQLLLLAVGCAKNPICERKPSEEEIVDLCYQMGIHPRVGPRVANIISSRVSLSNVKAVTLRTLILLFINLFIFNFKSNHTYFDMIHFCRQTQVINVSGLAELYWLVGMQHLLLL